VQATTVQFLAVLMGTAHGVVWALASRWERPGRRARLRARLPMPSMPVRGGYVALTVPLLYPAAVVIAPEWGYDGWLNWSSRLDVALQVVGLGLWAVGVSVLVWSAWTLGALMGVDGVTEDHLLVTWGPYRYVRHPIYGSFTLIAAGLALVFRSHLLAVVAAVWLIASLRWAAAEEALLASSEGFGDVYRTYRKRTGRFLPRPRRVP
jgi:protein-S-isoprenylcysteine O-methyltransferase Ste14